MDLKFRSKSEDSAELDVTSFMNLMVVLVPVLLMTMSFTQITVLDIHLPELTGGSTASEAAQPRLVVNVHSDGYKVYYPEGTLIQEVPRTQNAETGAHEHDYQRLSLVMQEVKKQLVDSRSVLLLSEPEVDYQNLVSTMDAVRSYETVVALSVVEVELFPEISLGKVKR